MSQTAEVIKSAKADIAGLQEIGKNAEKLARLLGWNFVSHGRSAILTRHKITQHLESGVKIKLDSGQELYIFNVHLNHAPYQPYQLLKIPYADAPFITTEAEAIAHARKARGGEISKVLKAIQSISDSKIPVFMTGDFNEPSHLDWTEKAAKSGRHPIKVAYPTSTEMAKAGFTDAWRTFHNDEMKKPGYTWTPLSKSDDPKDHHDRIDFVYFKGKHLHLKNVQVVGENKQNADITVSPYPSDHRAVVASFLLKK